MTYVRGARMKHLFISFLTFVCGVWAVHGQGLQVQNIKQLKLEGKQNYRSVKFSPDGSFLSFEVIKGKNYSLYLYDLKSDTYVKIGKKEGSGRPSFMNMKSLFGNEVTNQLSWFWNKKRNVLFFDFIHSPRSGFFQLYRGIIRQPGFDINTITHENIESSTMFEKYNGLQKFSRISYPSLSNPVYTKRKVRTPLVVMSIDKKLCVFNHTPNGPPKFITSPPIGSADLLGKFSPQNDQIVFVRDNYTKSDIGIVHRKANKKEWDTEEIIIQNMANNVSPEWAPGGKQFAFYSDNGHSKNFSIYIYDLASRQQSEVVKNVNRNHSRQIGPSWVDHAGFIYVKLDIDKKNPLMYFDLKSRTQTIIPTHTASNEDVNVLQVGEKEFLVAFTARGDYGTEDNLIWTKIYVMKITLP